MSTESSSLRLVVSGAQMLFVAFGALVLVPLLTGLNPSVALFTAGIGTLLFQWVTKRSIPIFLASSFAFIAPISASVGNWGVSDTMGGLMAAGGALGNLYDRIIHGFVVDFISVHYQNYYFPAFNLADTAITIGAALLIIDMLFFEKQRDSEQ
jgi:uracil permease